MTDHPAAARLVVFTDLDGTLLSHDGYDWAPARDALAELSRRGVPLIIASSKTREEIEAWQARLGVHDSFISENGGALYVPSGAVPGPLPLAHQQGDYLCVRFGATYAHLRSSLQRIARELGVSLRGFGDMDEPEIGRRTGLAGEALSQARAREYDEPFVPSRLLSAAEEARLLQLAEAQGLRVTRGGRFHHLIGPSSKGAAARCLLSAYGTDGSPLLSLGLGDGANDLELLREMDRPIVVARPDGTHTPELREALPHARFTRGIGPAGFNEGVLDFLKRPR